MQVGRSLPQVPFEFRTPNAQHDGVSTFANNPELDYARAAPIWSAAIDPHVVRVHARPCAADAPQAFDLTRYNHHVAISPTEEYVLVHTANSALRLDVISGTLLAGPVILELGLTLDQVERQITEVRKLSALVQNVPPRGQIDPRMNRLVLALRALDARTEGASLRDIANGIFSVAEWPGEAENVKSRVRRLVSLAQKLRRAGPRGVLQREL